MRRSLLVVAVGLLGGWSPLAAQSSPSPPPSPPTFGATVVVTASLEPEPSERLTATVDVVEAAEIEARQARLVLDLLRTMPALAVTQSGSPGKVASLFTRGTNSAHTLVVLDGVPSTTCWAPSTAAAPRGSGGRGGARALSPRSGARARSAASSLVTRRRRSALALDGERHLSAPRSPPRRSGRGAGVAATCAGATAARQRLLRQRRRPLRPWQPTRACGWPAPRGRRIGLPFGFAGAPSPPRQRASALRSAAAGNAAPQLEAQLASRGPGPRRRDAPVRGRETERGKAHGRLAPLERSGWAPASKRRRRLDLSAFGPVSRAASHRGVFGALGALRASLGLRHDTTPSAAPPA
jgi:hypothetical protein